MCIRDRRWQSRVDYTKASDVDYFKDLETSSITAQRRTSLCLLYTSDAADERSSVDLGGRRIIKKKKRTLLTVILRQTQIEKQ